MDINKINSLKKGDCSTLFSRKIPYIFAESIKEMGNALKIFSSYKLREVIPYYTQRKSKWKWTYEPLKKHNADNSHGERQGIK